MNTIITLCGSTKFKELYELMNKELTLMGFVVLSVGCFRHSENDQRIWRNKEMLDAIHLMKIDLSDVVFVINPDNYIGKSTVNEIAYAIKKGKTIHYYSEINTPDGLVIDNLK